MDRFTEDEADAEPSWCPTMPIFFSAGTAVGNRVAGNCIDLDLLSSTATSNPLDTTQITAIFPLAHTPIDLCF